MAQARSTKALRWLAWGAVLAAFALLWAFPGTLSRLRRAGADHVEADPACDLWAGPCAVRFPDGVEVSLAVAPRPVMAESPVRFTVRTTGEVAPTAVDLEGVDMNMGLVHVPLAEVAGTYTGQGTLPACTRPEMAWRADVLVGERSAGFVVLSRKPEGVPASR